ncbi:glycosyltransferase family 2 protein [Rubellimicrobium mesophilum]|uniref:glycosyltransferase family 2 protein n=1 Tax=Rubellimicrobium mesophilum TaxID=1123067 RepID=UPI000687D202|nr:glycosyltransferase [Rubellimicrobium mesophilum]
MAMPRVSIITPFLDAERYLAEAVESVRAQTFPDWELLLVDDGSSDEGPAIANRYVDAEPGRIRYLPPDPRRRGAAAARNRGIAAARGALIALLDADDTYLPEKLAHDLATLAADPGVAWLYRSTRWVHDGALGRDWTERPGVRTDRSYDPPHLLIRVILRERGDVPSTCGVLMRKTAVEAVGGFEERFRLYEDQTLWAKLMLNGRTRVGTGSDALYRQHPLSTSAAAIASGDYHPTRPHAARRAFLDWLQDYVQDHGADPRLLQALAAAKADCDGGALTAVRRRLRRLSRYVPAMP